MYDSSQSIPLFEPFEMLTRHPIIGLVPIVGFCAFGMLILLVCPSMRVQKSAIAFLAAIVWAFYVIWEFYFLRAYPAETVPIRVDLLFLVPLMWIVTIGALLGGAYLVAMEVLNRRGGMEE